MLQIVHVKNGEISNSDSELMTFTVNDKVDKIIVNIRFDRAFNEGTLNQLLSWIKIKRDGVDIISKFSLHFSSNRFFYGVTEIRPSHLSSNALTSSKGSYAVTIDRPS